MKNGLMKNEKLKNMRKKEIESEFCECTFPRFENNIICEQREGDVVEAIVGKYCVNCGKFQSPDRWFYRRV